MTKPLFNFDYYDGTASLLHNPELVEIIVAEDQLASEKCQRLHSRDLRFVIESCTQANLIFNQLTEAMGQLLQERQAIQQHMVETNPQLEDAEMVQVAGNFFTLIGGLRACVDRILQQAMEMRLSEAG